MAVIIDATVEGASSNSYLTLAEAETYHESHLYTDTWDDATDAEKNKALVMAVRLLDDEINWYGYKHTNEQALRWPRDGMYDKDNWYIENTVIPSDLKNASAELARLLLASDRTADRETIGFESIVVGSISLDVDKKDEISVVADSVYSMISHYGTREAVKGASAGMSELLRV